MHMHPLRLSLFALLLLAVLGLSQEAEAEEIYITIEEDRFVPSLVHADVGDEIFWYNNDTRTQAVEDTGGYFETGDIAPGENRSIVIDDYYYEEKSLGKETITFKRDRTVNFTFDPSPHYYLGSTFNIEFFNVYYPTYDHMRIVGKPAFNSTLEFTWKIDEFPNLKTERWINEQNDPVFSVEVTFSSSGNKSYSLRYNNSYVEGDYDELHSYFYDGNAGMDYINATIYVEDIPKPDFSIVADYNNLEVDAGEKIHLNISLEDNTVWPTYHAEQDVLTWDIISFSPDIKTKDSTPENPKWCWLGLDTQNSPGESVFAVRNDAPHGNGQHMDSYFGGAYGDNGYYIYETSGCDYQSEYYIEITYTLKPRFSCQYYFPDDLSDNDRCFVWNTIWLEDNGYPLTGLKKIFFYTDITVTTTVNITVNNPELPKDKGDDEEGLPGFGFAAAILSVGLIARARRD